MDFKETTATAFEALLSNKLRTGLAILGIVIGIGAVVALITLGKGAQKSVTDSISSLGSNLLTISPGATNQGGIRGASGSRSSLTLDDVKAISNNLSSLTAIQNVSAETSQNFQATHSRNNTNVRVSGVTPSYSAVNNISMSSGSFITEQQNDNMSKVAVIGPTVAEDLFGTDNPVSQTIKINQQEFLVTGVTTSKGGGGFMNQDELIYIPITTAQKVLMGTNYVQTISVSAKSAELMDDATDQVGYFLLRRHRIDSPEKADFSIRSQADILSTATETTSTLTGLLSGIAAISLLVGGIGIMNVMLVTITERTREIGIRKAIGAKRKDILAQFLIEAIVLTVSGGILGIVLGFALSYVGGIFLSIPMVLSFFAPLLAFSVSGGIGLIFGYYPARRAALLQPIVALRYE